jgi:hypothetical protein
VVVVVVVFVPEVKVSDVEIPETVVPDVELVVKVELVVIVLVLID